MKGKAAIAQIKFLMNGYAHQILTNQVEMMRYLAEVDHVSDARVRLTQRIEETRTIVERLEKGKTSA